MQLTRNSKTHLHKDFLCDIILSDARFASLLFLQIAPPFPPHNARLPTNLSLICPLHYSLHLFCIPNVLSPQLLFPTWYVPAGYF